jgi:hypothetical protein
MYFEIRLKGVAQKYHLLYSGWKIGVYPYPCCCVRVRMQHQ